MAKKTKQPEAVKPLMKIPNVTRGELVAKKSKELAAGETTVEEFSQLLRLTDQETRYAELYTSPELKMNGEQCALIAFDIPAGEKNAAVRARAIAKRMGTHQGVISLISALLTSYGWNDENVRKHHLALMEQNADLKMKAIAIKMYYEVTGKLNKNQEISVKHSIDPSVYNMKELINLRNAIAKGQGRELPDITEDIDFTDIGTTD